MTTNNSWNIDLGVTGEGLMGVTGGVPAWDASPTYSGIITGEEIHATNIQDQTFTGFLEFTGAGSHYTVAGTTFTLDRPGSGYIKGIKYTWVGGQSTAALAAGALYFISIDTTGTLQTATTRTNALFEDEIALFEVLVDNASNVIVVRENHPYTFPVETSNWAHDVVGTVIANKNNGANIVLNGTKGIEISGADELEDHGLETDIPDSGGAAVTFSLMYTDGGGKWIRNASQNTFPSDYNNAGAVANLGANKYGIFRLYVSKDDIETTTPTYYAVYDDAQYNNLVAAQTAVALNVPAFATNEFVRLEMAQLGFIIKEQSSDNIVDVIIEKSVAGTGSVMASSSVASLVTTDVTNFDGWLSAADTTVQAALDTLDDQGKNVTPEHAVLVAGAAFDITTIALGATKQVLVGNTGGQPGFNASPTVTELTSDTNVNAATFDTNVAAAAVTLTATTLSADGTDANIPITITPKGTEAVTIDGLDYPMADGNAGETIITSGAGVLSIGILTVPGGGTGAATLTDHALLVGNDAGAIGVIALGADKQILVGSTGNDPNWNASPTVTELTSDTNVNAATFDTNVAAAAVTLTATTLSADGTDANIPITITPKGTEAVTIDGLDYPMADGNAGETIITSGAGVLSIGILQVAGGGTGSSTLLANAVLVGDGTNDIVPLAVGTTGQLLVGSTAAPPAFGSSANADFTFTSSTAGATRTLTTTNTNNANAASHAQILAETGGASGGDPFLRVSVSGAQDYSFGIENSGSDDLVITDDATPSAGNELWNMTSAGERIMPLQPAFFAYLDADVANVTGTSTVYTVILEAETFDQGGDFNVGTGTFTAPVTGKYQLSGCARLEGITGAATSCFLFITTSNEVIEGSFFNPVPILVGGLLNIIGTSLMEMDAADTAVLQVSVNGEVGDVVGVTGDVAGPIRLTYFSGFLAC